MFIGANVKILQDITIGDNSVIGAGAVISQDAPDNVILKAGHGLVFLF